MPGTERYAVLALVVALLIVLAPAVPARAQGSIADGDQKVRISLKNGAVFEGLVRPKEMFERLEKGWFRSVSEAEARRTDGIRVWYPGYAQGFVFLRKKDIRTIEKLDRVKRDEAAEIQKIVSDKARRAIDVYEEVLRARERLRQTEQVPEELVDRASPDPGLLPLEEPAPLERLPGEFPLLDRFPPENGWSVELADRIEKRKWLIGVFPNSDEKAFLSVLPRWREQLDEWSSLSAPAPAMEQVARSEVGTGQEPGSPGPVGTPTVDPKTATGGPGSRVLGDAASGNAATEKKQPLFGPRTETRKNTNAPTTPKKSGERVFRNPRSTSPDSKSTANPPSGATKDKNRP